MGDPVGNSLFLKPGVGTRAKGENNALTISGLISPDLWGIYLAKEAWGKAGFPAVWAHVFVINRLKVTS